MPMCNNIGKSDNIRCIAHLLKNRTGLVVGPIIGGLLANPVENYPNIFGDRSTFGGEHGVQWMRRWPYLLPNLVNAVFLFTVAVSVFLGLEEVPHSFEIMISER